MDVNLRTDGKLAEMGAEWGGYTTSKNLAKIGMTKPRLAEELTTYLGTINSKSLAYEEYLRMVTTVKDEITDEPIEQLVYGDAREYATLKRVITENPNKVGYNKETFTMVFDAPLFSQVNTIVGISDMYRIRLLTDGREAYGGWAYKCKVMGSSRRFIPATAILPNSTWTVEGAPVSLYNSEKGAKTNYTSPYKRAFYWSTVSIEDNVPGNMVQRPVTFGWVDENNNKMWTWEDYRSWSNDVNFRNLKNRTLIWGRSNMNEAGGYDDIDEDTGVEIVESSGAVEQIERGNIFYHNEFDIEEFGDQIVKLRLGKNQTDSLHYVVNTGTMGAIKASKQIAEKARDWTKADNTMLFKMGSDLGFGGKFTRYIHPGGIVIDFRVEALLDDQYRTFVAHPDGGNARGYEYIINDMGMTKGKSSMELRYVKSMRNKTVIVKGMRDPFSVNGEGVSEASSTKDAWTERRMSHFMLINKNPKNSMIYRPNIIK